MKYERIKRFFDLGLAASLIVMLSPLFSVIALFILFKDGFPVLFCQKRPGLNGNLFTIYKYRTMIEKRNAHNKELTDANRLSSWGRILREMSLDELPELWNVLKGEMSLVGPRPLLVEYLRYYTPVQIRRHKVKPGITGWAQVNGRNSLTWEKKFEMDLWYVDHISFRLDLQIMALSVLKIIKREGINQPGYATSEKFMGKQEK